MQKMANINKELNDIKNAVYGKEVRGSIHDGIKKINDEVENNTDRQDSVEAQFQSVLDETTGKDVISAPEINAAKVGADNTNYPNLKQRLDAEYNKTAQQLAQTEQVIERLNDVKASKTDVNRQIAEAKNESKEYADGLFNNLDGLQIKGGFDSLQELINTYPNGTEGLFVVGNNLYGWNGSEWKFVKELEVMPWADFMTEQRSKSRSEH